jgi:SAM-dependent methyltransferase
MKNYQNPQKKYTSWEGASSWYDKKVGESGLYFHEHVIIPNTLKLLSLKPSDSILDLGCGNGILARAIPSGIGYTGVDTSDSLLSSARKLSKNPSHEFFHADAADATKDLTSLGIKKFSHACFLLSLQNMEHQSDALQKIATLLRDNGTLVLLLNHPCFRIPRQSSWGIDETNKIQYRRINRYASPLAIPLSVHPGNPNDKTVTWSFHEPLSYYFNALSHNGFVTITVEEWYSDKESSGKAARMENRSRSEIPLFLAIKAVKMCANS